MINDAGTEDGALNTEQNAVVQEEFPDDFFSKRLFVAGKTLLMWENPMWTGVSFILLQAMLVFVANFTLVALAAYFGLALMIAGAVLKTTGREFEASHPLHTAIHADIIVTHRELLALATTGTEKIRAYGGELRQLILWSDPVPSLKLVGVLSLLWLSGGVLDMHVILAGMYVAGPIVQAFRSLKNQKPVDEQVSAIPAPAVEEDIAEVSEHSDNSTRQEDPPTSAPSSRRQSLNLQHVAPQQMAPQQAAPHHTTPHLPAPQHITPQYVSPQNLIPQHVAPQHVDPPNRNMFPQSLVPQSLIPQGMVPQNLMPHNINLQHMVPQMMTTPQVTIPQNAVPPQVIPQNAVPQHVVLPHPRPPPAKHVGKTTQNMHVGGPKTSEAPRGRK